MAARLGYTISGQVREISSLALVDVYKFKADDPDDDEHDRKQPDNMVGITEENNSCHYGSCSADPSPDRIGGSDWDGFHGLRNGKEAHHNENNCDDARNELAESLTIFQGNGKADFKKSCQ